MKIFQKNPTRSRWEGTFSQNEKKFNKKYKIAITFTTLQIALSIYFQDFYKDKNNKLHKCFYSTNHSGDSHGGTSPTNDISFQLPQT